MIRRYFDVCNFRTAMLILAAALLPIAACAGDEGASNIDPYAEGPTDDNEWIKEGAHLMILAPAAMLDAYPTDPENGGPYVMWKGTPYQHLMVPVGPRPD
ncbi:MAG: hypothetical protein WBM87_07265 [Woeseiaceae bacterium]